MTKNFSAATDGERLDVFLKHNLAVISREKIKKAILNGLVSVDGSVNTDPNFRLKQGQTVSADIDTAPKKLQAEKLKLNKLFENDDFLVIEKPAGLVVHPGAGVESGTLANALIADYPEMENLGEHFRPGIVHRLDKDTSGLMLVAKNSNSFDYAKKAFKDREVGKQYIALVHGRIEKPHGFIDKPLELAPKLRKVRVSEGGKASLTEYKVLGYFQSPQIVTNGSLDFYTLIRVILHTGRTHQIRVHFAHVGHPLAGDTLYGKGKPLPSGLTRQFLHAARLTFRLPDGTSLDIESRLPDDLEKVLSNLKKL